MAPRYLSSLLTYCSCSCSTAERSGIWPSKIYMAKQDKAPNNHTGVELYISHFTHQLQHLQCISRSCRLITKTADWGSILSWAISVERFPQLRETHLRLVQCSLVLCGPGFATGIINKIELHSSENSTFLSWSHHRQNARTECIRDIWAVQVWSVIMKWPFCRHVNCILCAPFLWHTPLNMLISSTVYALSTAACEFFSCHWIKSSKSCVQATLCRIFSPVLGVMLLTCFACYASGMFCLLCQLDMVFQIEFTSAFNRLVIGFGICMIVIK